MKKERIVIIDTDMENEIDDKFALVYALRSNNLFTVDSITIAPFSGSVYTLTETIEEGSVMSYNTTKKILAMNDVNIPVYMGSYNYLKDNNQVLNDASLEIIRQCENNGSVTILALGALTNIAIALESKPEIAEKLEIIWLGGNILDYEFNDDFNLIQDVAAVRKVYGSCNNLTIVPVRGVGSALLTSIYEFEHYTKNTNKTNEYLASEFRNKVVDYVGRNKVLWDLGVVSYFVNTLADENWFLTKKIKCPKLDDEGNYTAETYEHEINYVYYVERNYVYRDFYTKLMKERSD